MKRISLLTMIIVAVLPTVSRAYNYCPVQYRTRWSPYAFGLVSGDVRYSPYAYKYGHSGLVPGNVRYSPYAFSYKHSGLVTDYWCGAGWYSRPFYYEACRVPAAVSYNSYQSPGDCGHRQTNLSDQKQRNFEEKLEARKQRIRSVRQSKKQINKKIQTNGMEIISKYLKNNNIDFRIDRILAISNMTISVDFLIKDKNIIIKYWNPEEILLLKQQPEYKRNCYEKYLTEWKGFCQEYMKTGGKIHQIVSAKEQEILAKLMLCDELNDG